MPAEDEAGCLGAAMQAMYAYERLTGGEATFSEIANRCVRVLEGCSESP